MRIAVSGKSGCGNTTVSRLLAQGLGVRFINYTFRTMAQERGIPFPEFLAMAEHDYSFDRELDARQVELASDGDCVLGSRLAIWLLNDADLKVYLRASAEVRARRIWNREGGDLGAIVAFTKERDAKDRERYLRIYEIDNDDYSFADLVIDTEKMVPEEIVGEIMKRVGAIG